MVIPILYAPWRYEYIKSVNKEHGCILCEVQKIADEEALILARRNKAYIIMNLYPYNTGHVMVVPNRHVPSIEDLDDGEVLEIHTLTKLAIKAIKRAFSPHGFNIGINIGRVAGAGIDQHVHVHIVPRWSGDTNFMPIIAGAKVLSQDVRETYKLLKKEIDELLYRKDQI